jgi:hypothetical protein
MSRPTTSLEQLQRWMQTVIMHPGGTVEAVGSPEARRYIDIGLGELESIVRRSRALSSAERLEIYVNAYYARLMECLDEEFAVTRYALGEELFSALAFGYLQSYPSRSYTLAQLGADFPRYLAESRLHAQQPPANAAASWPEFVIELATLERSLYEVYDGPGTERSGTFSATDVAGMQPETWANLRLVAAPCLRLFQFEHPVHQFWAARKDGGEPTACQPRPTALAVSRRDYVVERQELAEAEFALLERLVRGETVGQAIAAALESSPSQGQMVERQIGRWFARWASAGYFSAAAVT